jgi:hybrid cluster-associated redox disulfide protein
VSDTAKIHKDMIIMDAVNTYPDTMEIFFEYGIHCVGCGNSMFETIEQGAELHGFNLEDFLDDLNSIFED